MILSITLQKKLPGFTLDVHWEARNEITVLFGYSGAGKSMTLDQISGFMRPDCGRVMCRGKVYFDSAGGINVPPQKRPFGYVFQSSALFPHMNVEENVRYGLKGVSKTERNRRAGEIMERMQLRGLSGHFPAELSGGQKQRAALARTLVRKPEALLLDEPLSSLDNHARREMQVLLKNIKQEFDIPIILITHDIVEAHSLAGRIIVYSGGKIQQSGTPDEVLNNPKNPSVQQLVEPFGWYRLPVPDPAV